MTDGVPTSPAPGATHIRIDGAGVAWIDDTAVKVREVVLDRLAYGWEPGEIHFQHPNLSLAQIHAAFAWYYDHQAEIDAEIERDLAYADAEAARQGDTPLRAKLRRHGYLQ